MGFTRIFRARRGALLLGAVAAATLWAPQALAGGRNAGSGSGAAAW